MQKLFAVELVFVLILFIRSGESLKCYVCRSDVDEGCKSGNMNDSLLQDCTGKKRDGGESTNVFCRKISQQLRFKGQEDWTSIRECAHEKGKKPCYMLKWVDVAYQETCECSEDKCNRGNGHHSNVPLVIATISMWMFNYLKTDHT